MENKYTVKIKNEPVIINNNYNNEIDALEMNLIIDGEKNFNELINLICKSI